MKNVNEKNAELTCRGTTYLVSDARDRLLTAEEQFRLSSHIQKCPKCQVAARQFFDLFSQLDVFFGRDGW